MRLYLILVDFTRNVYDVKPTKVHYIIYTVTYAHHRDIIIIIIFDKIIHVCDAAALHLYVIWHLLHCYTS